MRGPVLDHTEPGRLEVWRGGRKDVLLDRSQMLCYGWRAAPPPAAIHAGGTSGIDQIAVGSPVIAS